MFIGALLVAGCGSSSSDMRAQAEKSLHRAVVPIEPKSGSHMSGTITFEETGIDKDGERVLRIDVALNGLKPGEHGMHIHVKGDCSDLNAEAAGGHFDLEGMPHGALRSSASHTGDLGNVMADEHGAAYASITNVTKISLSPSAPNSIVGRAIVVHGGEDDLMSQPSGDSGRRVGCGVIALER